MLSDEQSGCCVSLKHCQHFSNPQGWHILYIKTICITRLQGDTFFLGNSSKTHSRNLDVCCLWYSGEMKLRVMATWMWPESLMWTDLLVWSVNMALLLAMIKFWNSGIFNMSVFSVSALLKFSQPHYAENPTAFLLNALGVGIYNISSLIVA